MLLQFLHGVWVLSPSKFAGNSTNVVNSLGGTENGLRLPNMDGAENKKPVRINICLVKQVAPIQIVLLQHFALGHPGACDQALLACFRLQSHEWQLLNANLCNVKTLQPFGCDD